MVVSLIFMGLLSCLDCGSLCSAAPMTGGAGWFLPTREKLCDGPLSPGRGAYVTRPAGKRWVRLAGVRSEALRLGFLHGPRFIAANGGGHPHVLSCLSLSGGSERPSATHSATLLRSVPSRSHGRQLTYSRPGTSFGSRARSHQTSTNPLDEIALN